MNAKQITSALLALALTGCTSHPILRDALSNDHGEQHEHSVQRRPCRLGVELSTVLAMAELLGPEEDFDGLVTSVEDAARWAGDEL